MLAETLQLCLLKLQQKLWVGDLLDLDHRREPVVHRQDVLLDLVLDRQVGGRRGSSRGQLGEVETCAFVYLLSDLVDPHLSGLLEGLQSLLSLGLAKVAIAGLALVTAFLLTGMFAGPEMGVIDVSYWKILRHPN